MKKPAEEDFYNVEDFNDNADIIDEELHNKVNKSEYTANDVLDKLKTVDGTGSGLDADKLDGKHANDFIQKIDKITLPANTTVRAYFNIPNSNVAPISPINGDIWQQNNDLWARLNGSTRKIYHEGNDGTGSGLDADKLDGKHASDFATAEQGTKADNALPSSEYTANDVLDKLKTVDGSGSGLDADTVDGIQGADLVKKDGSVPMDNLTIGTRTGTVGPSSFAQGNNCEASGARSHAEGNTTTASGSYAHAEGSDTTASGSYAHAEGYNTTASGARSHAEGNTTTASGSNSHAGGYGTTAQGFAQTAIGRYNNAQGNPTTYTATNDAFIIGNGTSTSATSNAFRVTFDGKAYGLSAYNSSGADYAEYFEWEDGNLDCEDRVGYFVTLDGEKIRKANSTDDYILGVVSANATVIGDTASENWHKKYITDEFGRIQYEYVDVPAVIDDEGNEIEPARQDYVPKINPEWDSSQEYIPREERSEWSAIGMMGKLLVRDDGTCQVNGYCKPNDNGIATSSENGYRVMKRVSENIIQILVR